jgi:hypothetical protein
MLLPIILCKRLGPNTPKDLRWYEIAISNEENFKHFVFKTKNGNAIVYGMNQHYVMKLQFRTNEGPLVYWVQVFYIK